MRPPIAFAVCGVLWAAWTAAWLLWSFRSSQSIRRESLSSRLSYVAIAVLGSCLLFVEPLPRLLHRPLLPPHLAPGLASGPALSAALGIALTLLGMAISLWARYALGVHWSATVTVKAGHELIRTGPYRLVRHPIYSGILLAFAGTALVRDQLRAIPALLLFWLAFAIKARKEERFMRQTFGARYDDYAAHTGAIVPQPRHLLPRRFR